MKSSPECIRCFYIWTQIAQDIYKKKMGDPSGAGKTIRLLGGSIKRPKQFIISKLEPKK